MEFHEHLLARGMERMAKEQARIAQDQAANLVANAQDAYARIRDDNAKVSGRDLTDAEKKLLQDLVNLKR